MKVERRSIVTVHDQTNTSQSAEEVFHLGPEVAWALDRRAAEMHVRRIMGRKLHLMDQVATILVRDDGTTARLMDQDPLDLASEKAAAKAVLLMRLTPDERALLEEKA